MKENGALDLQKSYGERDSKVWEGFKEVQSSLGG
jgi:hypothetical protein